MRLARTAAALALTASISFLTGCDLHSLGAYRAAAAPAPAPAASTTARAPAPPPARADMLLPPTVLRAKAFGKFGTLVVDLEGRTLYRSDRDTARPPRSRCTGACLRKWIPALVTGAEFTVAGVDPDLVGTIRRGSGARQLTIAGWPVYTFVRDTPGALQGQCRDGFFAITPEGRKTTMSP